MNFSDTLIQDVNLQALQELALAEQHAQVAQSIVQKATGIVADYRATVASIRTDGNLSPLGQDARVASAADKAQRELSESTAGRLKTIASEIAKLDALLNPPAVPGNDAVTVSLLIERRAILRNNDGLTNAGILIDAAAHGDTLTFRAITEAPSFDPAFKMDPQLVLKAKQLAAERAKPEVARALKDLRTAYAQLESVIAMAANEIGGLPDPLYAAAGVSPVKRNGATVAA